MKEPLGMAPLLLFLVRKDALALESVYIGPRFEILLQLIAQSSPLELLLLALQSGRHRLILENAPVDQILLVRPPLEPTFELVCELISLQFVTLGLQRRSDGLILQDTARDEIVAFGASLEPTFEFVGELRLLQLIASRLERRCEVAWLEDVLLLQLVTVGAMSETSFQSSSVFIRDGTLGCVLFGWAACNGVGSRNVEVAERGCVVGEVAFQSSLCDRVTLDIRSCFSTYPSSLKS